MKSTHFILLLLLFGLTAHAQQKIRFDYDASGNQVQREWCSNCLARMSNPVKDVADIQESDLSKFFPEDVISYYPNPVKEELFLKWELTNDSTISEINIFNINGSLLKSINNLRSLESCSISFNDYPQGIYFLEMKYNTEEIKSIKIIKQ